MIHCGVCVMNTICIVKLSILEAIEQFFLIIYLIAERVGLLYAPTRWGIVACHGQANRTAVRERHLLLHQSFSKRAASDNHGTIVVLHSPRENLACRCREIINQYGERHVFETPGAVGFGLIARVGTPFGINNHLPCIKKLVGHTNSLVHKTARVLTQIHNICRCSLCF